MNADRSDAPDYLRTRSRKPGLASVIPWLIGTIASIAILHTMSTMILGNALENLASAKKPPKPEPIAEIYRPQPATKSATNWDRIVEEQAQRDATLHLPQPKPPAAEPTKQTVFNDHNYTPQGANNILAFKETAPAPRTEASNQPIRVTVIKETKDSTCWPLREGSIERRNCKAAVKLNNR